MVFHASPLLTSPLQLSAKMLHPQIRLTNFHVVDGVPTTTLQAPHFLALFNERSTTDPGATYEKTVWQLAGILFDDIQATDSDEIQTRKATLSRFWADLVADASSSDAGLSKSSEIKAVASLSGHRIPEACRHLTEGRNFHLATLVALIGTSDAAKRDMREQLTAWQDSNFLSEFSEPIRAIYEMLSGNVCVCEGKKSVPLEDRMDSFVISAKFSLDWMQAFGLRLWYAISLEDDISVAVRKFHEDIEQDREPMPRTWFAKHSVQPLWEDRDMERRQDLLWGLLCLYSDEDVNLESIIRPENSQLSPLDSRLSWQLGRALTSSGKVTYGEDAAEKADSATLSFAGQLVSEGSWLEATFVLLHLSNPATRVTAVREHLCRHAGRIGGEQGEDFNTLTQTFKIPPSWIWEAMALYMKSVRGDATSEVQCLIRAGAFSEAHRRFVEHVAPLAIIERDYQGLASTLSQFEGREESIADWAVGGEVYRDFLVLIRHASNRGIVPTSVLRKLLSSLPAMHDSLQPLNALNTAAMAGLSDVIARTIANTASDEQVRYPFSPGTHI
jgi:nuclear pore complex protein Nup98-Nup96